MKTAVRTAPSKAAEKPSDWTAKKGPAEGLHGLWGKLRLVAASGTVGVLTIEDGEVHIEPRSEASTVLSTDSVATMVALLSGELHPVVARLQGRAWMEGDASMGLRILLGLRAGSPWRKVKVES
jgi:hypothetical protein